MGLRGQVRRGQALLVVLLVVGVALTVGLAIVSRSVTEVSISTTQEEASRALEAAEAGVEKSLAGVGVFAGGGGTETFTTNDATVNVTSQNLGAGSSYRLPYKLEAGDVASVELNGFSGPQIRLCWGEVGTHVPVEVMLYSTSGGNTNLRKWIYGSGFAAPEGSDTNCAGLGGSSNYGHNQSISTNIGETLVLLRVRMMGNATPQPLAVVGVGGNFPTQARDLISAGTAGTSTQKIRVIQVNADVPMMFDAALFSGTNLDK